MVRILLFCHHAYMKSNPHMPLSLFCSDHLRYVEYSIGITSKPLPARFDLLSKIMQRDFQWILYLNLRHSSKGKKVSTASQPRSVEAQYQDDFYRGFIHVAGRGVPISSEWSRTKDGRVDFYIPEKKWAIELLRDHDKVDEHISRFKEGGKYHPWLKKNMVKNWIIIDCATSLPTNGMFLLSVQFSDHDSFH